MFLSKNKQHLTLPFLPSGELRLLSKAETHRPDFHYLSQGTRKEKLSGLMEIPESESRRATLTQPEAQSPVFPIREHTSIYVITEFTLNNAIHGCP
jgi:hypothetical protein